MYLHEGIQNSKLIYENTDTQIFCLENIPHLLFSVVGFYLQQVPCHIDTSLFMSLLTKRGYCYSLQCSLQQNLLVLGLLFLITCFSTSQILLSET